MGFNWWILTASLICFTASQAFMPSKYMYLNSKGTLIEDWCTDMFVFRTFTNIILYECADECMRRTQCLSFLYHSGMKFCMLRREATVTPTSIAGLYRQCLSSDIMTWNLAVIGPCATRPCDRKSRCQGTYGFTCSVSECLHAPEMPDSKVVSSVMKVGSKTLYFCLHKYTITGEQGITCTNNGSWSTSNFMCKRQCDFGANFDKAVIHLDASRIYVENDTVDYECAKGYTRDIGYENEKLVCYSTGTWSQHHCILPEPVIQKGGEHVALSDERRYSKGSESDAKDVDSSEEGSYTQGSESDSKEVDSSEESSYTKGSESDSKDVDSSEESSYTKGSESNSKDVDSSEESSYTKGSESTSNNVDSLEESSYTKGSESDSKDVDSLEESSHTKRSESDGKDVDSSEEGSYTKESDAKDVDSFEESSYTKRSESDGVALSDESLES